MTIMVRTISTIMVCEINVLVLPTIVAEGYNGWKKGEYVYLCDG